MPRRDSSLVKPLILGGKPVKALTQRKESADLRSEQIRSQFIWERFCDVAGLDTECRSYLEHKRLGDTQATVASSEGWSAQLTEAVRRRLKRALGNVPRGSRAKFETVVRGGSSMRLSYRESLGNGLSAWSMAELGQEFAEIMARERQNILTVTRECPKPGFLGGTYGSAIMQHTTFKLELKSLGDSDFEGDLAVYSNVDYGSEIIQPGSFKKSLEESKGIYPLFLNHASDDLRQKVGVLYLTDSPKALKARGVLNLELVSAQEARSIMRFDKSVGLKTSMSIGYRVIKDKVADGIRTLTEISLHEGSLVGIGMNPLANVTAAKHFHDAQVASLFEELHRAFQWDPSYRRTKVPDHSAIIDEMRALLK